MKKGQRAKDPLVVRKTIRFTKKQWGKVVTLAKVYAGGDAAKWIRHGALEAERKFLK